MEVIGGGGVRAPSLFDDGDGDALTLCIKVSTATTMMAPSSLPSSRWPPSSAVFHLSVFNLHVPMCHG